MAKNHRRYGRWVDWERQYRTMDPSFMESVWWVFSKLHEKGLIYKDHKIVPYSPRNATVLSNFEANQNYKDVQDPAVSVKLKLKDEDAYLLVWTTTPWTLISNLAVCVSSKVEYVKIHDKVLDQHLYLAKQTLANFYKKKQKNDYEVVAEVKAEDLKGKSLSLIHI